MTPEEFQRQFRSKTLAYTASYVADDRPIVVTLGNDAHSPAGHALLVGLVNQLARAHQHLAIVGDLTRTPLCASPIPAGTLADATLGLAHAINPFIRATNTVPFAAPLLTIGLGQSEAPVDLRVGCDGWLATVGSDAHIGTDQTSILGAMLAATITASFAFHWLLGSTHAIGGDFSLWEFGKPHGAQGPDLAGPLDVGRVLQVGAGGVGSALDFWLTQITLTGTWTIIDGDLVEVSNLNRQLIFTATDAGYPTGHATNKAIAAAAPLPAAFASPHWYGADPAVSEANYDVVLALANERGVRGVLQARQPTVLLHATTSPNWEAQFHRHIAGLDDCISCRIPEAAPATSCAEGEIDAETATDAALPFLSAAAGLFLLAGLIRLQQDQLTDSPINFAALNLKEPEPVVQSIQRRCHDGCTRLAPPGTRRVFPPTRFATLDPALT